MNLTDVTRPEIAFVLGVGAFVLFLVLYAIGSLFSRGKSETAEVEAATAPRPDRAAQGPSYAEIAARQSEGFVARGDEPVFTAAPDYSSVSMEIPASASYTQVAAATASAAQRGLKPKVASHQPPFMVVKTPVEAKPATAVQSYAAIAAQTVGEPRLRQEAAQGTSRVDYSTVDVDLSALESYAAVAVAAARGQAAQAKTLH